MKLHYNTNSYRDFIYNRETDTYTCPNQKDAYFYSFSEYRMNIIIKLILRKPKTVKSVLLEKNVLEKPQVRRTISRPIAHELLEENIQRTNTREYKQVQKLRRVWCEGSFGTMKIKHNLYKTYKRGIEKIHEQCLFSALALNLKRMIKAMN